MASQTPPKAMSSRLLTMKFMQRAAATSTASSPTTPQSEEKSSKRRKTSHSPAIQQTIDALVDEAAVKKAIADEERKREEALVRNAAESGDARWVLNTTEQTGGATRNNKVQTPFNVVQVGFAQIDSPDHTDEQETLLDPSQPSSQHVWRYNMDRKEARSNRESENDESDSDSTSDSDSDESSQVNGRGRQSYGSDARKPSQSSRAGEIRKALQGKRSAESERATQFAEKRRKKEVKLNKPKAGAGLSSISSGGGSTRNASTIICHRCQKPGHKAVDCKGPARSTTK